MRAPWVILQARELAQQEGEALHEMKNVLELEDLESDPASVHLLTLGLTVSVVLSLSVLLWGKKIFLSPGFIPKTVCCLQNLSFSFPFPFPLEVYAPS